MKRILSELGPYMARIILTLLLAVGTVISTLLTATIGVTLCYLTRGRRKGSRREIAP